MRIRRTLTTLEPRPSGHGRSREPPFFLQFLTAFHFQPVTGA